MSDIMPGDRVKVEFEGTVINAGTEFVQVRASTGASDDGMYSIRASFVTRLAPRAQAGEAWVYRWDGRDAVGLVSKAVWGNELNITVTDDESESRTFMLQPDRLIRKLV